MPQQRRTSILTHLAEIVQNVIAERYAKVIKAHEKKVAALEQRLLPSLFDAEAQRIYEDMPSVAATMNKTAFTLTWLKPGEMKPLNDRIAACAKVLKGYNGSGTNFSLSQKLEKAACDGRSYHTSNPVLISGNDSLRGPLRMARPNSYVRVGPVGHSDMFLRPKSSWEKGKEYGSATRFVRDADWLQACELQIKLLEIYTEQTLLSLELMAAFEQRKTIERFIEDFPDLKKHVPHIPEPVRALIVPASAVQALLEAVPAE
jgi:hypothetical protein